MQCGVGFLLRPLTRKLTLLAVPDRHPLRLADYESSPPYTPPIPIQQEDQWEQREKCVVSE
jgi:hypothetical protein